MPKPPSRPAPLGLKKRVDIPTETPSRDGFKTGRGQLPDDACPHPTGSRKAAEWHRLRAMGKLVKIGRGKQNASPWCQRPTDCAAAGKGLCVSCNMKRLHASPEFIAKRDAKIRAAGMAWREADPDGALAHMRAAQKKAVEALLKPDSLKRHAKRAREMWKDPDFRAKHKAGTVQRFISEEEKHLQRERLLQSVQSPEARAKRKSSRIARGLQLSKSKRRKIARAVRETSDNYCEIGRQFGVSATTVRTCAREFGTARR